MEEFEKILPNNISVKYLFQFYRLKKEAIIGLTNKKVRSIAKEKADYWGSQGIYLCTDTETGNAYFSM